MEKCREMVARLPSQIAMSWTQRIVLPFLAFTLATSPLGGKVSLGSLAFTVSDVSLGLSILLVAPSAFWYVYRTGPGALRQPGVLIVTALLGTAYATDTVLALKETLQLIVYCM